MSAIGDLKKKLAQSTTAKAPPKQPSARADSDTRPDTKLEGFGPQLTECHDAVRALRPL